MPLDEFENYIVQEMGDAKLYELEAPTAKDAVEEKFELENLQLIETVGERFFFDTSDGERHFCVYPKPVVKVRYNDKT